jgi:uncharacterized membrane protein HdeD (DUF308 family)
MPLIRGLLFVVLGLLLTVQPLHTLGKLTALFAGFLVIDAVVAALQGWLKRTQSGWRWWLGQGAVDVLFAILILVWPGSSTLALFYLMVVWTLVLGVVSIIGSVALARNRDLGWSWLLTIGLVSTLFGFLLVTRAQKTEGALDVIVMVFGIYALIIGAIHIVSGFSVRSVAQEIDRAITGTSPVINAMAERKVAATAAAEARSQAKSEAKAQAKAEAAQLKKAEKEGTGEAPPVQMSGRIATSPEERERRFLDELAAQSFPDTPGVVQQPVPLPMDEDGPEPKP